MAYAARTALPSCVDEKASPRACTTNGPRISWRPARSAWLAIFSAKPVGPTTVEVVSINVDISLTALGRIAVNLLVLVTVLGIGVLAATIAFNIGLTLSFNPFLVAIGLVALLIIANIVAEPTIEAIAEGEITAELNGSGEGPGIKPELDASSLVWFAGEGLSESLARRVLQDPSVNEPLDSNGRDRFKEQFWQMIICDSDKCGVWIRK